MVVRGQTTAAFRGQLSITAAPTFAAITDDELATALGTLYERGASAWPDVPLETARFAGDLARRLGDAATPELLGQLHHDVYLAIAAADGEQNAVVACDRACAREVDFAAARLRATPTQTEDVRAELRSLLFTSEAGRTAALITFSGRGDLRGFTRVIAARALARRMRRDRREATLDDDVFDAFTHALDPDVALLREQYRPEVDAAFRAAITALPPKARAMLRYHLLDGWTIDQIGAQYGVHRATAARWLTAAREQLGASIRSDLADRLGIPVSQVDSIVALVTSRIEVSLERLLAPD